MHQQIVYILTNESMPDYIKIGITHGDLNQRLKQLDRTGVPLPFEVYYAASVNNAEGEERWLHSIFGDRRARGNREFFKMNPELAALALKRVQVAEVTEKMGNKNITKDEAVEIEQIKQRRSRFHFAHYGIPVGSRLVFTRDNNVVARVVENDKIEIDGVVDSMSSFAGKLLGYRHWPQGTMYFEYDGEILDERRQRLENDA